MIELLAPAGNMNMIIAAIKSGANAVYLGVKDFGARASASNFSLDELKKAREITALHNVKIYLTLNTLVKQKEISALTELIYNIADIGVDAILVQDIGVASLVNKIIPNMPLHASTQMAIHSASGARFLKSLGFERVVLARECSLETISEVVNTGIEVEVFVHGALCVAMSGQCLISSFNGGRSGNRGRCAQVCRQKFSFNGTNAAYLSARDIMLYNILPELIECGVSSLKIEGRLKSPSYVASVCTQYRKGIDNYYSGKFQKLNKKEYFWLMQSFNRGDFTESYPSNKQDAGIINFQRSNNHGVLVGYVEDIGKSLVHIRLVEDIENRDMLRLCDDDRDFEIIYSGKAVKAGDIASTYIRDKNAISKGMSVYRLISEKQAIQEQNMKMPQIDVSLDIQLIAEKKSLVKAVASGIECVIYGDVVERAKKAPLTIDRIEQVFNAVGEYDFNINNISISAENIFVPISKLNELRRNVYSTLRKTIIEHNINKYNTQDIANLDIKYNELKKDIIISYSIDMLKHIDKEDAFIFDPHDLRHKSLEKCIKELDNRSYVLLNTSISDKDAEFIISLVKKYSIAGIVIDNISQLGLNLLGLNIGIGEHVPIINNYALEKILEYKPNFILAYPEISMSEISDIHAKITIIQYSRERVMILHHCPARTALGMYAGKENCNMCHTGDDRALISKSFIDNKNSDYPLLPIFSDEKCIVYMYNKAPTSIASEILQDYPRAIAFCNETLEEQIKIYRAFKTKSPLPSGTLGHIFDEIL